MTQVRLVLKISEESRTALRMAAVRRNLDVSELVEEIVQTSLAGEIKGLRASREEPTDPPHPRKRS